jgi:hypothetical protein
MRFQRPLALDQEGHRNKWTYQAQCARRVTMTGGSWCGRRLYALGCKAEPVLLTGGWRQPGETRRDVGVAEASKQSAANIPNFPATKRLSGSGAGYWFNDEAVESSWIRSSRFTPALRLANNLMPGLTLMRSGVVWEGVRSTWVLPFINPLRCAADNKKALPAYCGQGFWFAE